MIEIDYTLLSEEALDNLIIEVITRQGTDYGAYELAIQTKKKQLLHNLQSGKAIIVFSSQENACDIISQEDFRNFMKVYD
ncbi:YheU family protein [Legionella saoudiensis]|uniref:YheU family protein n=1 Tax=Legionella saoudiensis TaxID=1750561 RepID=UPI0007317C5F|nr:YheU family protein [Legionella saoudiensis]